MRFARASCVILCDLQEHQITYLNASTQLREPNDIIGGVCNNGTAFNKAPRQHHRNCSLPSTADKNCAPLVTNLLVKHLNRDPTDLNSIQGHYSLSLQKPTFQELTILPHELPWHGGRSCYVQNMDCATLLPIHMLLVHKVFKGKAETAIVGTRSAMIRRLLQHVPCYLKLARRLLG